jgi:hypothetical protein
VSGRSLIMKAKVFLLAAFLILSNSLTAISQDEARAVWQVTKFDIKVANLGAERALNVHAVVSLRNIGKAAGSTISLRLNAKAEVKAVTVGDVAAPHPSTPEARGGAQRIRVRLPSSVAPDGVVNVAVDYRLPVDENTGLAAISPLGSQFLPLSLWYPQVNTPLALRGADTAPFRLSVSGANAISSGVDQSSSGESLFEQSLSAMPFFVAGNWDRVEGAGNAKGVISFPAKGASADERKQAEALMGIAADARSFFTQLVGPTSEAPVRLVAVTRGAGFDDSGTLLLNEAAFRRGKIDALTAMSIAESIARAHLIQQSGIRGEGYGVLRDGLARFLATLFIEKEFGPDAAEGERARERLAFVAIAKRDAPLSRSTPLDETYFNSVGNKGAMVWRLVDHMIGRETFVATLRTALQAAKNDPDGLSLARLRAAFAERGGSPLKSLLDYELDQPTDMDLLVGLPRLEAGQWTSALRNLGSIEVAVSVAAFTESGERLTVQATIPPHDFGQVSFKTLSKIARVEVDPEKYYPQQDFTNDVVPHSDKASIALSEATRFIGAQDFPKAETLAREMLVVSPRMQEAHIILARALLGENKNDEAEKEARQMLEDRLPTPSQLAWANIVLGEVAMRRGQAAEAAQKFNDAVRDDAEYPSTSAARAARIRAESAANATPVIDPSIRTFLGQVDAAIRSGRKTEIDPLVVPGELGKFIRGLAGTPSDVWETRILRTEQLDANRTSADVELHTKELGVEHSGTAVLIMTKITGSWKLTGIEYFEVK